MYDAGINVDDPEAVADYVCARDINFDQAGDVLLDGVNLAARIEACAESGEVMISESALMDGGLEVWVDSKREFIPKDIDRSIIIYRLSGTGTEGATLRVYIEQLETDPANLQRDPQELLAELIGLSLSIAEIEKHTGRTAPDVIT